MSFRDMFADNNTAQTEEIKNKEDNVITEPVNDTTAPVDVVEPEQDKLVDVFNLVNINLAYGKHVVFDNFNLGIPDIPNQPQFISILGTSGTGKSLNLKMLTGLLKPDSGHILFNGSLMLENQSFPMVFQQYSSFEWMTVLDNVALPMVMNGVKREDARAKAMDLIKLVGLEGHEDKYGKMPPLSGGQLQRVAIARGLATGSSILFLDEYSSGLDIITKHAMQDTLLDIFYKFNNNPTFINVTHDISEAVYLSDRVIILKPNPCRLHKIVDIKFDVPKRDSSIRNLPEFFNYMAEIESAMREITENNSIINE